MHYLIKPYLVFKSAAEIARHPALLDAVEGVLGPNILLWDSAYIVKEDRDPRYVSWHQDLTYWGLDSDEMVTAWVALSPSRSAPKTSQRPASPFNGAPRNSSTPCTTPLDSHPG